MPPPPEPPGAPPETGRGAPAAPDGSFLLATWGRRGVGLVIDSLIFAVPEAVARYVGHGATVNVVVTVVGPLLLVAYSSVLIARDGATWGMRAVGVRVVDASTGGAPGVVTATSRSLVTLAVAQAAATVLEVAELSGLSSSSPVAATLRVVSLVGLLTFFWPIWDARRQTWQDKAADTVVVRVEVPAA